jgi:3-oxoacyl-[acyl-carrier protein] reductase
VTGEDDQRADEQKSAPAPAPAPASRSAIVTGGSRGIGLGIAHKLAARRYGLTLVSRSQDQLDVAADQLRGLGVEVMPLATDLASPESAAALIDAHASRFGRLDTLVVNAGTGSVGNLEDLPAYRIDRMIDVNLRASLRLVQAALPLLIKAGESHANAWVVLISSITGKLPPPGYSAYGATKAALISLAKSINVEGNPHGLRAVALCPGYVDTTMTQWIREEVDPGQMLTVSDLAETVDYLLRLSTNAVVSEIAIARVGAPLTAP